MFRMSKTESKKKIICSASLVMLSPLKPILMKCQHSVWHYATHLSINTTWRISQLPSSFVQSHFPSLTWPAATNVFANAESQRQNAKNVCKKYFEIELNLLTAQPGSP